MNHFNIIGLGNGGSQIATTFADLPDYSSSTIFRIDCEDQEIKKPNCVDILITRQPKAEDYDANPPNIKKYFKKIKGEVLFIVAGAGSIAMASLSILEQLKSREITVIYIKPDIEFLGAEAKIREKVIYNVFQEYARSGLFKRLYLVSNTKVEQAMGGVSIISYFDKINKTIVNTFHTMIALHNLKPVTSTFSEMSIGTRISTFGIVDAENNEEKLFFA